MSGPAWSQDAPADIATILAAAAPGIDVYEGRAPVGASPPFVIFQMLDGRNVGRPIASEDAGVLHVRWQVTVHGLTQGQARWWCEQVCGYAWPDGWEYDAPGFMAEDTTDKPGTWYWPHTFLYRGTSV